MVFFAYFFAPVATHLWEVVAFWAVWQLCDWALLQTKKRISKCTLSSSGRNQPSE
jgi:hypothetical protein